MACPTCDHTMENIGQNDRADNYFLCPRCGTIKIDAFGQHGDEVYVPRLVKRCREFEDKARYYPSDWHKFGIAECLMPASQPA